MFYAGAVHVYDNVPFEKVVLAALAFQLPAYHKSVSKSDLLSINMLPSETDRHFWLQELKH